MNSPQFELTAEQRRRVSAATFTIHTKEGGTGLCVLIEGGYILTAAHCVEYNCDGSLALDDFHLTKIKAPAGEFKAATAAIEPVSDIALLCSPDTQMQSEEADAFETVCESVLPVKIQRDVPERATPFPAWILTHEHEWMSATAEYFGGGRFMMTTHTEIKGGTSGGPIINAKGELVGVVSTSSNVIDGESSSMPPFAALALPAWVLLRE